MKIIPPTPITDGATFSRASTATYFDADGVMQTAAIDEPRWNHEYRDGKWIGTGLLVEGQATNLLRRSADFVDNVWNKARSSVNPSTTVSPDPSSMASKLIADTQSGAHYVEQQFAAENKEYVFSFFVKAAEETALVLYLIDPSGSISVGSPTNFNLVTGTVASGPGAIVDVGGGWYRVSTRGTVAAPGTARARLLLRDGTPYIGNDVAGLYIWGAQLEQGSYPTSYIPTTDSQVTRAPDIITGTGLVTTNVPENDYPEWSAGTLSKGDRRIVLSTNRIYEVVASTTTDDPLTGIAADPPTWIDIGFTNRWRAFDAVVGSVTEFPDFIHYTIMPGVAFDAVAFFGVDASDVQVIVNDPVRGEIFNSTAAAVLSDGIGNWYDYFFAPIELRTDFIVNELGGSRFCWIDIIIRKSWGVAKVGEIAIGRSTSIGDTLHGTSVGITDYSRKERDQFGNTIVVERAFSKRVDYLVAIPTPDVGRVQRLLAQYRATPIVWVGHYDMEETIVYGFYRDFDIVISNPAYSDANISVEGLT